MKVNQKAQVKQKTNFLQNLEHASMMTLTFGQHPTFCFVTPSNICTGHKNYKNDIKIYHNELVSPNDNTGWFKKTVFYDIVILSFLLALYMDILIYNVYITVGTLTITYKQISHKVSKIE
jgi:hypothetical protein